MKVDFEKDGDWILKDGVVVTSSVEGGYLKLRLRNLDGEEVEAEFDLDYAEGDPVIIGFDVDKLNRKPEDEPEDDAIASIDMLNSDGEIEPNSEEGTVAHFHYGTMKYFIRRR